MTDNEFSRFFRTYRECIYRVALCSLKDPAEAEDITQDVFCRLLADKTNFTSDEHVKAWLIRVTINRCRDIFRSPRYRLTEPLESLNAPATQSEEQHLLTLILTLKPKIRTALYMYYYEGYPVQEIANILGEKKTTITTRLKRGREQLKKLLEEDNYGL